MKNAFLYIIISLAFSKMGFAQSKDTVLNTVISKPFFYNVIEGKDGKIYAGTSKGIFELEGIALKQQNDKTGYIINTKKGLPDIDSNGIRYYKEKKYLHLLPYPEMARDEYHAIKGDHLYICSGGRIFIFDLLPYGYSYPNHSFRTISKDLLGTYSGIYLRGTKLPTPVSSFVDGYIRQFGDRAFICNYNLLILEKEALESGKLEAGSTYHEYNLPEQTMYNDIYPAPDTQYYYVATEKKLIKVDHSFTQDSVLFTHDEKDSPIGLITENKYSLHFFAANKLMVLNYQNDQVRQIAAAEQPILAGLYYEHQVYLITTGALLRYNSGQRLEKIADLKKAHSIVQISGSELVISTDNGLYLYNMANRSLSLIIEGVEFNRRALHREGDLIYAGSINGLYTINIKDIPVLIEKNAAPQITSSQSNNTLFLISLIVLTVISMGAVIYHHNKKIGEANKKIEVLQTPKEAVTRKAIEEFILSNLANASIKTISDKFNLNAPQIYSLLKPDRPGTIIQQLRLETLKKMKTEGRSIDEIADATGLSISYLKRLKG